MRTRLHTVDGNSNACFESIRISIGSIRVNIDDVLASVEGRPNRSQVRKRQLNHLLNEVYKSGSDLLVMPEVSVPFLWLGELGKWVREHDIGIIVGLEHEVSSNVAYNRIATILPLVRNSGHRDCYSWLRVKRHYSPDEEHQILNRHLACPPQNPPQPYDLFRWRGAKFAVYNCYELADIADRALFKSKVDFIICSELNRDVHYFSNIVESAVRDLHCYVIQANDSHYGDSRIVSPSKREEMDVVRFKGGENCTFLKATLKLQSLRKHQAVRHGIQRQNPDFKLTPPRWDVEAVRERMKKGRGRNQ
jgi:hypothetical protein